MTDQLARAGTFVGANIHEARKTFEIYLHQQRRRCNARNKR